MMEVRVMMNVKMISATNMIMTMVMTILSMIMWRWLVGW